MKILHLTLKRKWFEMILRGEKPEEYREIKWHWIQRLTFDMIKHKSFDIVRFRNGYDKDAPTFDIEFRGIEIREGNPEWGAAPSMKYFVIRLGKLIFGKNLDA